MNQSEFLSAHTSWLRADLMYLHWLATGPTMRPSDLNSSILTKPPIIYLFVWQALLFVVIEFMYAKDAIPSSITHDVDTVYASLKKLRHAIFHAQNEFVSQKLVSVSSVPDYIQVIQKIHSNLGAFLCDGRNQPEH